MKDHDCVVPAVGGQSGESALGPSSASKSVMREYRAALTTLLTIAQAILASESDTSKETIAILGNRHKYKLLTAITLAEQALEKGDGADN
jgi:hypothetical protein